MSAALAVWSRGCWLVILLALLALSVAALALRVAGYPAWVPQFMKPLADAFLEPGAALWWFTSSSLFQSFPSSTTGQASVILGNTLFWFLALLAVRALWRVARR